MSARRARVSPRPYAEYKDGVVPPNPRKKRPPRVRLTHLEVRRGETLRLRIAIAADAIAELGDELGALIKKLAPSTQTSVVPAAPAPSDLVISRAHSDDGDNTHYHANVREHLVELFSSLCDTSLADALEIAREERARRAEGSN